MVIAYFHNIDVCVHYMGVLFFKQTTESLRQVEISLPVEIRMLTVS